MFEAGKYRDQAARARDKAEAAPTTEERNAHRDRAQSLDARADNELWLAENLDAAVQDAAGDRNPDDRAAEESHILRCLGAAVIMHWNTLPTKLQRELFDTAGAMGDLLSTPELRGRIARFLHRYKDGDGAAEAAPSDPAADAAGPLNELYRSANGDRWLLGRDGAEGPLFVRHEPNASSGGRPSQVGVDEFLRRGGCGPETQELLRRLATDSPLAPR
jgi:hypothetical protein